MSMELNKANECTCPSGDGSLVHPCPAHPAVEQAGGDERAAFELFVRKHCGMPAHIAVNWDAKFTNDAWEGWKARAALAQPSPVRSSLLINGYQLRAALDFIAPDGTAEQLESEACIEWRQQDADFLEAGLYAFCAEYPEEGGVLLDEEPTTAQPSPLQSEQAEAERPEVVGYLATAEHPKHGQPHKAFNYLKDQHDAQVAHWRERGCEVSDDELMTVAQHGRIVGALRARNEKLEADAGALEWLRSTFKVHKAIVEQAGCGTIEQLAEQRDAANSRLHEVSVACATAEQERDAALARVAELEKQEPVALANRGIHAFWVKWTEAAAGLYGPGIKLYAHPVAQAQHSVPEGVTIERDVAGTIHIKVGDFDFIQLQYQRPYTDNASTWKLAERIASLLAAAPGKEVGHE
ncbi:hypothetical protein ACM7NU_03610 [Pseudomonas aeruginosa]